MATQIKIRFSGIKDIIFSILLATFCILLVQSPSLIGDVVGEPVFFQRVENNRSVADLAILSPGDYYISVGNPREICEIDLNGRSIASNQSEVPGKRNDLFLGAGFSINSNELKNSISVFCPTIDGFYGFKNDVIVAKYNTGVLVHLWRKMIELLIAPIASFLLILYAFFVRPMITKRNFIQQKSTNMPLFEGWRLKIFATTSFAYSLSLALYPRLFLGGMAASVNHILLRNLYSLTGLLLFTQNDPKFKFIIRGQVLLLGLMCFLAITSPNNCVQAYSWEYSYFLISCGLVSIELFRRKSDSRAFVILKRIMLTWALVQIFDAIGLWIGTTPATPPAILTVLTIAVFYLRFITQQNILRINIAAEKILEVTKSNEVIQSILKETAYITMAEIKFRRVSAYIDGFCLGLKEFPSKTFYRIAESGYIKSTAQDSIIDFNLESGQFMEEAIQEGKPILNFGNTSGHWFINVPIGKHAVINLTADKSESRFNAMESFEIVNRIFPSLISLEQKLINIGYMQGAALQKLRSKRGDGRWEEEFGSIFVDINDYSQYADEIGEPFTNFISGIYVPALIKAASECAGSEHVAGDEVYFIVTKDFLSPGLTLQNAVEKTLLSIDKFVFDGGSDLCTKAGFSSISVSIGINLGLGHIVADAVSVRTTGKVVNHAKRLQEEAGRGGILVAAACNLNFNSIGYSLGEEILIQRKKQVVLGIIVHRKSFVKKPIFSAS